MKAYLLFMVLLVVSSSVSAAILTSGDAGEEWAINISAEKCSEQRVDSVYICLGNVVKVVSTETGAGSTFYKPDGKIVSCPIVAAPQLGAECIQLTMPNYCPGVSVCGEAKEQVFPGHSDFDKQVDEVEQETEPSEIVVEPEVQEQEETPEQQKETTPQEPTTDPVQTIRKTGATGGSNWNVDILASILDSTAVIVLGIGLLVVVLIYAMFKRTTR